MKAWLIGGLQFVPVGWDASLFGPDVDYESAPFANEIEAWSICPAGGAMDAKITDAARVLSINAAGLPRLRQLDAIQDSVCRVLMQAGRLPIHGAFVTRQTDGRGVLILGDSGRGKSSLTWLAISQGWGVVSDDLVALRPLATGQIVGTAIRKRLRIPAQLVDGPTRSLGRRRFNHQGLRKVYLDPEVLRIGSFVREARIDRMVFLERGPARSIVPLSRTDTLERLLAANAAVMSEGPPASPFGILAGLARQADARVATLTQSCLTDPDVLEQLSA